MNPARRATNTTIAEAASLNEKRMRRLVEINEIHARCGIAPFTTLGEAENGDWEILDFVNVFPSPDTPKTNANGAKYVIMQYLARPPYGTGNSDAPEEERDRYYFLRFTIGGANKTGCAVFCTVYDPKEREAYVVLVRQARITTHVLPKGAPRFLNEAPRMFRAEDAKTFADRLIPDAHPSYVVGKELASLFTAPGVQLHGLNWLTRFSGKPKRTPSGRNEPSPIHGAMDDSSYIAGLLHVWHLALRGSVPLLREQARGTRRYKIRYVRLTDFIADPSAHDVFDKHTFACAWLVFKNAIDHGKALAMCGG